MEFNHIHVGVRDLPAARDWLPKVWAIAPSFENESMASVMRYGTTPILDAADEDAVAQGLKFDARILLEHSHGDPHRHRENADPPTDPSLVSRGPLSMLIGRPGRLCALPRRLLAETVKFPGLSSDQVMRCAQDCAR